MSRWLKQTILLACLLPLFAGVGLSAAAKALWAADEDAAEEELYEDEEVAEEESASDQDAVETPAPAEQPAAAPVPAPTPEAAPVEEDQMLDAVEEDAAPEPAPIPAAAESAPEPPALVDALEPAPEAPAAASADKPAEASKQGKTEDLLDEEQFLEEEAGISKEERISPAKEGQGEGYEVMTPESGQADAEAEAATGSEMAEIESAMQESEKIPSILTTLEDCKRVALLNDPRAQVALRQIQYDRMKVQEGERTFLPSLKGTWERQEGDQAGQNGSADTSFNSMKYALEGESILFQGGKQVYTLKQYKNNLDLAKKKFYQAKQEVIFKVEKAYYTLVKAQMVFEVQADLSKAAESGLSFSREAYRQGLNAYHEFLNVQSQTDQTYYQLLSNQQEITMGELGLRQACNIDSSIGIQIDAVLTFTDFNFNYSLDECMELAFKNRPDLAVSELTTLSDLYGIKVALAENYPKIVLTGNLGKNGQNQAGQPFTLTDEWTLKLAADWSMGANLGKYSYEKKKTAPKTVGGPQDNTKGTATHHAELGVFDKLENLSAVAKAKVQQATTEAELVELRAKVANEVEENYFNYQKAMTMVTASLSKIKYREKDLEISRAKHMMDEVPLSQVLTAELQLGEERVNYVKALSDYYIAISGLFKAMGLAK